MTRAQQPTNLPNQKMTTPWCSVIIPTLNEGPYIGRTLKRLNEAQPTPSFELIVADGGSTDETVAIARSLGARIVSCPRGRAAQMNAAAAVATGESLLFLHADTLLPHNYHRFFSPGIHALPACFRLRFANQHASRLLAFYSYCTRFDVDAFRFGDQALWVMRADFEAVGGYPSEWKLLEDNYLVRRLRNYRGGFRILPDEVTTSPRKYLRNGFAYTQLVYALLYILYRFGAGQSLLTRIYLRFLH